MSDLCHDTCPLSKQRVGWQCPKWSMIRPPTSDELRRLLDACVQDHAELSSLIYVAATTGARRGELCGLR